MRKKIELAVLLLFLAVLVLLSKILQKLVSSGNVTAKNKISVLDSGHGGDDPGKIGVNQEKEKDVKLEIARKIKKRLENKNWRLCCKFCSSVGFYFHAPSGQHYCSLQTV